MDTNVSKLLPGGFSAVRRAEELRGLSNLQLAIALQQNSPDEHMLSFRRGPTDLKRRILALSAYREQIIADAPVHALQTMVQDSQGVKYPYVNRDAVVLLPIVRLVEVIKASVL